MTNQKCSDCENYEHNTPSHSTCAGCCVGKTNNFKSKTISEAEKLEEVIRGYICQCPTGDNSIKIAKYILANYRPKSKSVDSEELRIALKDMTYNHYPRENYIYIKDIVDYLDQQTGGK